MKEMLFTVKKKTKRLILREKQPNVAFQQWPRMNGMNLSTGEEEKEMNREKY